MKFYTIKLPRFLGGIVRAMIGVFNKKEDLFQTVAKVGTGLSDKDWKD